MTEGLEGTLLMEGLDPDVDWKGWKGRWKRTSIGRDVGSGRQLEGFDPDVNWKGLIRTSIGRGLDPTLVVVD